MQEPEIGPAEFGVDRFCVADVLDRRADQFPDRVLISIDGVDVSVEQMRRRSNAAAHALVERGIGAGDGVALFAGACPEWIYYWLGAARIGAVTAAVNTAYKGDFLAHALRLAQARVVITDSERRPRVAEVTGVNNVVIQPHSLDDGAHAVEDHQGAIGETGSLFFTSGTTGPSKAVATTWHYLFTTAAAAVAAWELRAGESLWTAMPLYHLSAAPVVLAPLLVGATTVLASAFHPASVWDEVRACDAVGFVGAGAMVSMLWNQPPDPRDAQLPLRFISAAPIAADAYHDIENRYGCRIVTMYGMTEAFPITVAGVADTGVPGTSGRPNPDFDVRIVDAAGTPLPPGSVGEIACRPRCPHVMSEGYLDPSDLAVIPHPEWFRTGDLGTLDTEDNLSYVDRVKDSLRRRGENISSVEVEQVLARHPVVCEAAVVAVPSALGEDDVAAFITVGTGSEVDCAELLDFCSARMPYFAVPRYVEVVSELPKTIIGRVRKDVLRSRGVDATAWDREQHGYIVSR